MATICATIVDESGGKIGSSVVFSSKILPEHIDSRFMCVRFVDHYGDTVFNRLQMNALRQDLAVLRNERDDSNADMDVFDQLEALIIRCHEEPHLYLKFIGD